MTFFQLTVDSKLVVILANISHAGDAMDVCFALAMVRETHGRLDCRFFPGTSRRGA
jgi:hypothetical protein